MLQHVKLSALCDQDLGQDLHINLHWWSYPELFQLAQGEQATY